MPRHPAANTNLTREIYWVSEAPFLTREHLNHATVAKRAAVLVMNEEQYYEFTSRMRTVNPDTPIVPYLTYRARIEEAVAEIRLEFTREGSELLSQFTRRHRLRRMAITVDDQVLSTPIINEHIKTGTMILSSGYSRESGKRVVRQMLRK
jgi:hypothetical protein